MVRSLALFSMVCMLSFQAQGADAPTPTSTHAQPPASNTNNTANNAVSPAYQKAMSEWVQATDFAKNAADIVTEKLKVDMEKDPKLKPSVTPALIADLKQYFYELFISEKMTKALAKAYSRYFSAEELNALVKFYKTPLGHKLIKATPALSLESEKIGLQLLTEHQRSYMEIVAKHVKNAPQAATQNAPQ